MRICKVVGEEGAAAAQDHESHNGEINTLRCGNKNWVYSRGAGIMRSEYYGDATAQLLTTTGDHMSDSGNFDM